MRFARMLATSTSGMFFRLQIFTDRQSETHGRKIYEATLLTHNLSDFRVSGL
jgi:hypothetical protein